MATNANELFLKAVTDSVDPILESNIAKFYQELSSSTENQPGFPKACKRLKNKFGKHLHENLKKFALYSERNLFTIKETPVAVSTTQNDELLKVRSIYLEKLQERESLAAEYNQLEALLNEMRESMFAIRLSHQSLDEHNVQPIGEFASTLRENCTVLAGLQLQAIELEKKAKLYDRDPRKDPKAPSEVETRQDVEDIRAVSRSMQKN